MAALPLLRGSSGPLVVLFGTASGTGLLEAARDDPAVRRHAFVLVTAIPDLLTPEWGALLTALDVPLVRKPFELHTLLAVVAHAAARIDQQDGHLVPA